MPTYTGPYARLREAVNTILTQREKAFVLAALHTEAVLSDDADTEQRIREKMGLL